MNDFSRQDIEALKASVDLCELIRHRPEARRPKLHGPLSLARRQRRFFRGQSGEAALQLLRLRG